MTRNAALAIAALAFCVTCARAQQGRMRYLPEPDYENLIRVVAGPLQPKDAFKEIEECRVVDAQTYVPVTLAQAEQMLAPCVASLGRHYGATLTLAREAEAASGGMSAQVEGLAIYVPESVAVTAPLMRDLQHALRQRQGAILGHRVMVRRGQAPSPLKANPSSALQGAVDACFQPMSLRPILSAKDFILYYGRCIVSDQRLKVSELRAAIGHEMTVALKSQADIVTVRSLNGPVTVKSSDGPVTVSVLAYPESILLP